VVYHHIYSKASAIAMAIKLFVETKAIHKKFGCVEKHETLPLLIAMAIKLFVETKAIHKKLGCVEKNEHLPLLCAQTL
jgi:hypothetical protein